jgi:hypothetical protein
MQLIGEYCFGDLGVNMGDLPGDYGLFGAESSSMWESLGGWDCILSGGLWEKVELEWGETQTIGGIENNI